MAGGSSDNGQSPELEPAELRHRLRNHLQNMVSLTNLQIRDARHPETVRALEDLRARFSVTRIHVDFDQGGAKPVALDQFLATVAHDIAALYDPMVRHTLSVVAAPLALPGPRALMVGQILIELLINAYRHGLADRAGGKVWIELATYGADAILLVADDGLGAADSGPTPFGLSMAANLARAIGGGLEPESRDSHVARVRFPLDV